MYKESGFLNNWEIKAKPLIKTGSGIDKTKFIAHEEAKIIRLLEKLWGQQFDKVTQSRVIEAMQKGDIPAGFLSDIDGSLEKWVKTQFMPRYSKAMEYAANGSGKVVGMMDDINRAVGAEILFNPNTIRMTDYITEHGVELAVQLQTQQKAALKTMLNKVLRRTHILGTNQNEITRRAHDLIRKSITLTNQETKWLSNFRDRTLKAKMKYFRNEYPVLFPDEPVLSEKQIIKRANRVTDHLVKIQHKKYQSNRSRRIMNTELTRAKTEGDLEAHRQALDAGIISKAEKQWQRNNYKDNWQSSIMYNGKRIDIDEKFSKYGIPKKTTMLNFDGPGEIAENCTNVYYVSKGEVPPKPRPAIAKPKPKKPKRKILKNKEQADKEMPKYFQNLTEKEMEAISSYTGSDYKRWNNYLRTGNKDLLKGEDLSLINKLKKVLDNAPAYEGKVLRGMKFENIAKFDDFMGNMRQGNITSLKGFTSTTADTTKNIAENFSYISPPDYRKGRRSILFNIKSKKGVYLDGGSSMPTELEVLFNDKSKFNIIKVEKKRYVTLVDMEEI